MRAHIFLRAEKQNRAGRSPELGRGLGIKLIPNQNLQILRGAVWVPPLATVGGDRGRAHWKSSGITGGGRVASDQIEHLPKPAKSPGNMGVKQCGHVDHIAQEATAEPHFLRAGGGGWKWVKLIPFQTMQNPREICQVVTMAT